MVNPIKMSEEEYENYLHQIEFIYDLYTGMNKLLKEHKTLPDNPFYDLKRIYQQNEQKIPLQMHRAKEEDFVNEQVSKIENKIERIPQLCQGNSLEMFKLEQTEGYIGSAHVVRWIDLNMLSNIRYFALNNIKTPYEFYQDIKNYQINTCLVGESVYAGSFCPNFTSCTIKELHTLRGYSLVEALNRFVDVIIADLERILDSEEFHFPKILVRPHEDNHSIIEGKRDVVTDESRNPKADYSRIKEHVRHDDFEEVPFSEHDLFLNITHELLENKQWLSISLKNAIEKGNKISLMCMNFDSAFGKDLLRFNKEYCAAALSSSSDMVGYRADDIIHDLYAGLFFSIQDCQEFLNLYTKIKSKSSFIFSPFSDTKNLIRRQVSTAPNKSNVFFKGKAKWYYFTILFTLTRYENKKGFFGKSKKNRKHVVFELYQFVRTIESKIVQYLRTTKNIRLNLDTFFVTEYKNTNTTDIRLFLPRKTAKVEEVESLVKVFERLLLHFTREHKASLFGLVGTAIKNKLGRVLSAGGNITRVMDLLKEIEDYVGITFSCLFFETINLFEYFQEFFKTIGVIFDTLEYDLDINRHEKVVDMDHSLSIFQDTFPPDVLLEATLLQYCQDSGITSVLQHIFSLLLNSRESQPTNVDPIQIPITNQVYSNPFPFVLLYLSIKSQRVNNFRLEIDDQAARKQEQLLSQCFNQGGARLSRTLLYTLKDYQHIRGLRHIIYATDYSFLETFRQDGSPFNSLIKPKEMEKGELKMKIFSALDMSTHNFMYSRCFDVHHITLKEFYFVSGPEEETAKHLFCSYVAQRCASNKRNNSLVFSGVSISSRQKQIKKLSADLAKKDHKEFIERLKIDIDGKSSIHLTGYLLYHGSFYHFEKHLLFTYMNSESDSTKHFHSFTGSELFTTLFFKSRHAFEIFALCDFPEKGEEHNVNYVQALENAKSTYYSRATDSFGMGERRISGYKNMLMYSLFSENRDLYTQLLKLIRTPLVQTFMYFTNMHKSLVPLITDDISVLQNNDLFLQSLVHNIEVWAERVERFVQSPGLTAFSSLEPPIVHLVKETVTAAHEVRDEIKNSGDLTVLGEVIASNIQSINTLLQCCETANVELLHLDYWKNIQNLIN